MAQELKPIRGGDIHDLVIFGDGSEIYHAETLYYLKNAADEALNEKDAEIRKLRRLLWHAIALFCARSCEYFNGIMSHCLIGQEDLYKRCEEKKNKYLHAMYKCRAKAEAYR